MFFFLPIPISKNSYDHQKQIMITPPNAFILYFRPIYSSIFFLNSNTSCDLQKLISDAEKASKNASIMREKSVDGFYYIYF